MKKQTLPTVFIITLFTFVSLIGMLTCNFTTNITFCNSYPLCLSEVAVYTNQQTVVTLPSSLNGGELEFGETIIMPVPSVSVPNEYTYDYDILLDNGPTNQNTILNKHEFKPAETGIYNIKYVVTVKNELGNIVTYQPDPVMYSINVKDTTAPVIYVSNVEAVVPINHKLNIPQFTASDLSGIDTEKSKVVLSNISFGPTTLYYGDTTSNREVTLSYNGIYTLTYYAYDTVGNYTTKTQEIKVGDLDAPELNIPNNIIKDSYKVNDYITVDVRTITITDNDTSLTYDDIQCTLFQGSIMCPYNYDNGIYTYQVFETGDYSIEFQVTDSAGNTCTEKIYFSVEEPIVNDEEENEEEIDDEFAWNQNIFNSISTIMPLVIILAIIIGFVIFAIGSFVVITIITAIVVTIVVVCKRKKNK